MKKANIILIGLYLFVLPLVHSQNKLDLNIKLEKNGDKEILICEIKNISETTVSFNPFNKTSNNRIVIKDAEGHDISPNVIVGGVVYDRIELASGESEEWEYQHLEFFEHPIFQRKRKSGKYYIYWTVNEEKSNTVEYDYKH